MSRGLYFHDQYIRVSHVGGIHRYKRDANDLTEAFQQVKIALATKDDKPVKFDSSLVSPTPTHGNKHKGKPANEALLKNIQKKLKAPIVPEVLCRDLDVLLQRFEERLKTSVKLLQTSEPSATAPESEQVVTDTSAVPELTDEEKVKAASPTPPPPPVLPKIVLPDSLLMALHSNWNDLAENAEDNYKVWRTKIAEDTWNRRLERKRVEQLKAEKHPPPVITKPIHPLSRKASRLSISSISKDQLPALVPLSNRTRPNHSLSRVSFLNPNADNNRLSKLLHHGGAENIAGLHVEFKLSTETDESKQTTSERKAVSFDIAKPMVDLYEDMIALIQLKCKRLLAEMKQKIYRTTGNTNINHPKMCKVWFYEDIHHMRNKINLVSFNELAKKQKTKFIFSILRKQIPERYNIDIEIPKTKHKCYIELIDGSIQVYYPSGRLAVLRLQPPQTCTLFFDDTDSPEEQFLGLVTSTGSVLIMQPALYARFVTDPHHERGYLCNGEIGSIDKQLRANSSDPTLEHPPVPTGNEEDTSVPPVVENTVQLQLNPSMQLEYFNPFNIRFAFACSKEEYKFQLGAIPSLQMSTSLDTSTNLSKKSSADRRRQSKSKVSTIISSSTHSSQLSLNSEKPQILTEKLADGQINMKELPMMKDLITLRKRIRNICSNWLKECRTALDITESTRSTTKRGVKSPRNASVSSKGDTANNEFPQGSERQQLVRTHSARKSDVDIIESTMMEFLPHSESGKLFKQKLNARKNLSSSVTTLPAIKSDGNVSSRAGTTITLDLPFACPNVIRQRLLQENPLIPLSYEICTCRAEQVPQIHDLEFDSFINLTNHLSPRQLIVVGIVNTNQSYHENNRTNELYEILQTLHYHLHSSRNQSCSCRSSVTDDYRFLIYDLSQATRQSHSQGPLLMRRHHVQPGFVLIYQNGRLIFGDSIFNGYGSNVHDLQNQLNQMKQQHMALPDEFKFLSDQRRANTTVLKSV
ncbi:unnamed protein product [Adineta ricciae]|uniref:FAM194 C-terminal domain-containing protein n=1 Tax=Adineta ricciae TaxID=249248 RepID=A0A813XCF2_ADIRI|nr:unnamed protein product [Adineta ricciae]